MNNDFYDCVRISEDGAIIRVAIVSATQTVFEMPYSAAYYFEIIADICTIILPIMHLDALMAEEFGHAEAKPADILAIEKFKVKYAGKITSRAGDII